MATPRYVAQESEVNGDLRNDGRRYSRLSINSRLSCTLAVIDGAHVTGMVTPFRDFSKSGAGLFTKIPVAAQTMVRISIEGCDLPPLEGRVIWCGKAASDATSPPGHQYCVGIDFMPRDDDARENQLLTYQFVQELVRTWSKNQVQK